MNLFPELEQLVLPDPIQRQKRACPYQKVLIFLEERGELRILCLQGSMQVGERITGQGSHLEHR